MPGWRWAWAAISGSVSRSRPSVMGSVAGEKQRENVCGVPHTRGSHWTSSICYWHCRDVNVLRSLNRSHRLISCCRLPHLLLTSAALPRCQSPAACLYIEVKDSGENQSASCASICATVWQKMHASFIGWPSYWTRNNISSQQNSIFIATVETRVVSPHHWDALSPYWWR